MRNRALKTLVTIAIAVVLVVVGSMAYVWFSGGTAQASAAITAPELKVSGTGQLFQIVTENSEVRFITHETLLGQPKTVVGKTNQVAGKIVVDFDHPANSQIGEIRINARTLATDNEIRNRAIRSQILLSSQPEHEFVNFVPAKLVGLPEQIKIGQEFSFQIVGKLTVRGVSHEVTFDAKVTPASKDKLTGSATTTVHIQDFNITIPEAPGVADVSQDVNLEFDFVAMPVMK
jgi:polyisoprenoid-binding protein YceI